MATRIAGLFVDLKLNTANFIEGLDKSRTKATVFGVAVGSILANLATRVARLGPQIFRSVVNASLEFESSFAGVRKTVEATEPELKRIANEFIALSKTIPVSTTELNKIGESAGQLGIKKENIVGFTKVIADLGATTNLSGQEAATALARLANITQLPQEQFDRLGSVIVELGNKMATTEAEIVEMGLRIAGAGKQIGLTEGEILAFGATLSSVGIEAQAGGSAISKVMIQIAQSVATGNKELATFASVAGQSTDEFAEAFRTDAAQAITAFIEGLKRVKDSGGNVFTVLEKIGITEVRMRDALLRASGAGDLLRTSLELQAKAWRENNALTNEAATRYGTAESELKIFNNEIADLARRTGDALIPALLSAIGSVRIVGSAAGDATTAFELLARGFARPIQATQLIGSLFFSFAQAVNEVRLAQLKLMEVQFRLSGAFLVFPEALGKITKEINATQAAIDRYRITATGLAEDAKDLEGKLDSLAKEAAAFRKEWEENVGKLPEVVLPGVDASGLEQSFDKVTALAKRLGLTIKVDAEPVLLTEELAAAIARAQAQAAASRILIPSEIDNSGLVQFGFFSVKAARDVEILEQRIAALARAQKELDDAMRSSANLPVPRPLFVGMIDDALEKMRLLNIQAGTTLIAAGKVAEGLALADADPLLIPVREATREVEKFNEVSQGIGQAVSSGLEEALRHWQGFRNALAGILEDIAATIIRNLVTTPLTNAISGPNGILTNILGGITGGASGGGGSTGPLPFVGGFAFATGGPVPHFASGGEVPAILHSGEFVMNRAATSRLGSGVLGALNRGESLEAADQVIINYNIDARGAGPGTAEEIRRALTNVEDRAVSRAVRTVQELRLRTI